MTVRISADIHVDAADIGHRFHPRAEGKHPAYGMLRLGAPGVIGGNVYFSDLETVRAAIAHLAALENEMAAALDPPAPVITDSGRTCDQAHPQTGAWCHKAGAHKAHRDTNGDTWTTAAPGPGFVTEISGIPVSAAFGLVAS